MHYMYFLRFILYDFLVLPTFIYLFIYIYIYINESRHICVIKFINIYMNVGNAKKSYKLKWR